MPVLGTALEKFRVKIVNFHSDTGSKYINKRVSSLLSNMLVEQTKSRATMIWIPLSDWETLSSKIVLILDKILV